MQMYLSGDVEGPPYDRTMRALADLIAVTPMLEERDLIKEISAHIAASNLYKALSKCRDLVKRDDALKLEAG